MLYGQTIRVTYHFFDNIDKNLDVPGVGLRAVILILAITPDPTSWSRNGLKEEKKCDVFTIKTLK